jgi:hypothetical protein
MNDTIRVFVNARALDLPAGADVEQAIRAYDPMLAGDVQSGAAYVTDGRGLELDAAARLAGGAILRVALRARRGGGTGAADADA